jgi:aarF domain-containing kinase
MPSASQRQQLAQLVLDLYHLEFYEWGLVQTDPNFSNFLVRELTDSGSHPAEDPEIGLVLLDFGATRIYDRTFVNNYIQLLKSITDPNSQKIVNTAIEFGILDDRESDESKAYFVEMMKVAAEPFFSTHDFHFSDKDYAVRSKEIIRKFSGSLKYSPPPHQILFLHRKLGGIFSLLKKLEVKMDVRPYWERIIHSV